MKKADQYKNEYPYEDLLPELDEREVQKIVNECDYTHEANLIALADLPGLKSEQVILNGGGRTWENIFCN